MEKIILRISINDLRERGFSNKEAKNLMNQHINYLIEEIWEIQSNFLDKIETNSKKTSSIS